MSEYPTSFTKINNIPECYFLDNKSDSRFTPRLYISATNKADYIDQILNKPEIFKKIKVAVFTSNKPSWDFRYRELDETKAFISFLNLKFPESFDVSISIREDKNLKDVYLHKPNCNKRLDLHKLFLQAIKRVSSVDPRHDKILSQPIHLLEEVVHDEGLWNEAIWFACHNTRSFELVIPESFSKEQKVNVVDALVTAATNYLQGDYANEEDPVIRLIQVSLSDTETKAFKVYVDDLISVSKELPIESIELSKINVEPSANMDIVNGITKKIQSGEWNWDNLPILAYRFVDNIFIADGLRRVLAAKNAGLDKIPVKFLDNIISSCVNSITSNSSPVIRFSPVI